MAVITLTKENFEREALKSVRPVLIDFYADWCGPCRMMAPTVHEIAEEVPNITVAKINVDEQPELAQAYDVMSIPTLIVLENGAVKARATGVRPKAAILSMLR